MPLYNVSGWIEYTTHIYVDDAIDAGSLDEAIKQAVRKYKPAGRHDTTHYEANTMLLRAVPLVLPEPKES